MRLSRQGPCRILALGLLLGSSTAFGAAPLVENNPFLPAGWGEKKPEPPKPVPVAKPGTVARQVEFRGFYEWQGETKYSFYDTNEKKSYWLRENESVDDIRIGEFNSEEKSIRVTYKGVEQTVALKKPNDKPLAVPKADPASAAGVAPKGLPTVRPPTINPATLGNSANAKPATQPSARRRVVLPRKTN